MFGLPTLECIAGYNVTMLGTLVVLVSGILLGVSVLYTHAWFLVLIALVPALYVFDLSDLSYKKTFLLGWVFGTIFHLTLFSAYAWSMLPLDWLGFTGYTQYVLIGSAWTLLSLTLGFSIGFVALWVSKKGLKSWIDALSLASLWVLCEVFGAFLFSIVFWGSGSLLGTHFSFGFIGYALANDLILVQLATVGGVYILSWAVVVINALLYCAFFVKGRREQLVCGVVVLAVLCAVVFGHAFWKPDFTKTQVGQNIRVSAAHFDVPSRLTPDPEREKEVIDRVELLISSAKDSDVLLLPESVSLLESLRKSQEIDTWPYIKGLFVNQNSLPVIIDSATVRERDGKLYNRIEYFDAVSGDSLLQRKQFLQSFGEYLPEIYKRALNIFGRGAYVDTLGNYRELSNGNNTELFSSRDRVKIATLSCAEMASPSLYKKSVKDGAQIIFNVASYGWFHGSPAVFSHAQLIAKVRAVENRRFYVQASNAVPSFIIDPYGIETARSSFKKDEMLFAEVIALEQLTVYSRFGNLILIVFMLILSLGAFKKSNR